MEGFLLSWPTEPNKSASSTLGSRATTTLLLSIDVGLSCSNLLRLMHKADSVSRLYILSFLPDHERRGWWYERMVPRWRFRQALGGLCVDRAVGRELASALNLCYGDALSNAESITLSFYSSTPRRPSGRRLGRRITRREEWQSRT